MPTIGDSPEVFAGIGLTTASAIAILSVRAGFCAASAVRSPVVTRWVEARRGIAALDVSSTRGCARPGLDGSRAARVGTERGTLDSEDGAESEDGGGRGDRVGRNLAAVVVAMASLSLPGFLVGTMAVQLRASLHFNSTKLGVAAAAFFLGAALSSVPASRLAEHIGGVRVMRLTAVAGAVVLVLLGTVARSWLDLTLLLFLAGGLSGAMSPSSNLFLARRSPQQRQGLAFGVKQAAVPLASLLGGLAVPAVTLQLGWQWTFRLSALTAVAAALLVPRARQSLVEHRRRRLVAEPVSVRKGALVVIAIGLGFGVMAASGTAAFLVSAAVAAGYSKAAAGVLAAAAGAGAVAARVVTGARADRRRGGHFRVVVTMLVLGAAGYALLAGGLATSNIAIVAVSAVLALGVGWGWNGLLNFTVVRSHQAAPAAATGITQVGGRLGGVLGPLLFGVVVDHGSYADAWLLAAGAALCGAGALALGSRLLARQPVGAPAPAPAPPLAGGTAVPAADGGLQADGSG